MARELAEVVEFKSLEKSFKTSFVSVDARELVVIESRRAGGLENRSGDGSSYLDNEQAAY